MKLLIADDDRQIVDGITEGIDWKSLGIQEVIPAYNGLEALELFTAGLPEIVITDIRMPGMDGLELLKKIKEINPSVKAVILSGYADFDYMKKAIQFGTVDYELKPVKVRSLINLIRKMKDDIIRERVSEENYKKYLASHKERFVEELLDGKITDRNILLDGLKQYFDFNGRGAIVCIALEMDYYPSWSAAKTHEELEKPFSIIKEQMTSGLSESEEILLLPTGRGHLAGILRTIDSGLYVSSLRINLKHRLVKLNETLRAGQGLTLSAGISNAGTAADIFNLYTEAKNALNYKLYSGSNSVNYAEALPSIDKIYYDSQLKEEELIQLIQAGDLEAVTTALRLEFDTLALEHNCSRAGIAGYCRSLLTLLARALKDVPGGSGEDAVRRVEEFERDPSPETLQDFRVFILEAYTSSMEAFAGGRTVKVGFGMQKALDYIRKNYNRDLTVEVLAEYVGKTPNYFSHLFKKELGISFTEYVHKVRIAKARELILHSGLLLYEIGEQVGYRDYAYFTQIFKKLEGCPPAELRKGNA